MIYESGAAGDLSALLTPTITGALTDPANQQAANVMIARSLESPEVRASIRPYVWEGAAAVGIAVLAAIALGRRV